MSHAVKFVASSFSQMSSKKPLRDRKQLRAWTQKMSSIHLSCAFSCVERSVTLRKLAYPFVRGAPKEEQRLMASNHFWVVSDFSVSAMVVSLSDSRSVDYSSKTSVGTAARCTTNVATS